MSHFQSYLSRLITVGLLALLPVLCPSWSVAQSEELSVDELYEQARQYAFQEGDYEEARKWGYRALERSPNYHGIRIFIARLYAWESKYEEARKELNYVLERDSDNERALSVRIDVEKWDGKNKQALVWTRKALDAYPDNEEFLLAKGSTYEEMEEYDRARVAYKKVLSHHPDSRKARQWLRDLRLKQMKYGATLSYRRDSFSEIFDPWTFWEFQLSRQTSRGSIIARVQRANRFSGKGLQFNIDAYPSIMEGMYAYVSGGYSGSSIYPRYRFGFSLYKSLPAAFELSAGVRYLDFVSSRTTFYTLSLTKYKGSYMFTGTTYYVPSSGGSSGSVSLLAQRYFGNPATYIGITGGYGQASTEIRFREDLTLLNSWSVSVLGQYPLTDRINIGGNVGFDSEELPNFTRQRWSLKAYISYRF